MAIFNVKDFGAKGNGTADDRAAIQAALDAAYDAGGGEVYIPEGVYAIGNGGQKPTYAGLQIRDNVTVYGDGMGETVIKVKDGTTGGMTGIMRTPYKGSTENVTVRDLTLDGNRDNVTGKYDGWFNGYAPGEIGKDSHITLLRMEIKDCSGYGFDPHEQTEFMTISDSVSHGNGLDGFVADFMYNSKFENNLAYDNDRHGFNVVTSTYDFELINNVARDNRGGGIVVQRGSSDIPSPHDILIKGGQVYGNALEGILIKLSDNVIVDDVEVFENGTTGIRIFGSKNAEILNSEIYNNSQNKDGGYDEIRIEAYDDTGNRYSNSDGAPVSSGGHFGKFFNSNGTRIHDNEIYNDVAIKAGWGVKEKLFSTSKPGVFDNDVFDNIIYGLKNGMIQLVGTGSDQSGNTSDNGIPDPDQLILGGPDGFAHIGGSGNDTIDGMGGKDTLTGGAGNDVFKFSDLTHSVGTNSMFDSITDFNVAEDKIDVRGLGFTDFVDSGSTQPGELRISYSASNDRSYIRNDQNDFEFYLNGDFRTTLTKSNFIFDTAPNSTPVVNYPLIDQSATEGTAFSYQFANITFADADDDVLTYTSSLSNNDPLPSWLSFDPVTRTFSGTPDANAQGQYSVVVMANDGNGGIISDTFLLDVADVIIQDPLTGDENANNLTGTTGNDLMRGFGGLDTINGVDGNDTVDGGAGMDTLTGGNGADVFKFSNLAHSLETALDRILDFNVAEDTIDLDGLGFTTLVSGTKTNAGELRLAYSANSDRTYVRSDQSTFEFFLQGDYRGSLTNADFIFSSAPPANQNPLVNTALVDQAGTEGQQFNYQFAADSFTDADGDPLTYTANLSNSDPLPAWLSFDPATRTFSGTPTDTASGQYNIAVTASDGKGGIVSDEFIFNVADVVPGNTAPVINAALVDQAGTEGQQFSYQFAADSFTDADGDALIYTAKLSNGNPLPAWLTFNAGTRTFSGTPTDTASGIYAIAVTARDGNGGVIEDIFDFNVADVVTPPGDAPIAGDNNPNNLLGTIGNDTILGNGGNDTISGLDGNDTIDGGAGKDTFTGNEGADVFKFSGITHSLESALDRITDFNVSEDKIDLTGLGFTKFVTTSGTKVDELRLAFSSSKNISLIKSDKLTFEIQLDGDYRGLLTNDNFIFSGGSTNPPAPPPPPPPGGGTGDTITGTDNAESLGGLPGNEYIFGLGGNDTILGGIGADTIDGGAGKDQLTGGTEADLFIFSDLTHSTETQHDNITDFEVNVDKVDLRGLGFTSFVNDTKTDAGELRVAYSGATDRSYIRSDQSTFEFFLNGDYRGQLDSDDFIFS